MFFQSIHKLTIEICLFYVVVKKRLRNYFRCWNVDLSSKKTSSGLRIKIKSVYSNYATIFYMNVSF